MTLAAGFRLGRYEILAFVGAGGMGEVYRARDTRLERTVAIKILAPHLADDERLRQRFDREARAVSALSHPHIGSLYDVDRQSGIDFIVLEYLEGETLAERLKRGPLPFQQLLRDAARIADALDTAHRLGVVHRDLKPGNIMMTKDGPKLLDFGLAVFRERVAGADDDSTSRASTTTRNEPLTVEGAIVGTLPYMAPEQVEGKAADSRTDVFALGSIVFEMVTGRRAVEGSSPQAVLAAILERDPPSIATLREGTPPALDHVVRRCLAKDPEARWQSARDVALELSWIAEDGAQPAIERARGPQLGTRERLVWLAGTGILVLAVLGLALGLLPRRQSSPRVARLSLAPPTADGVINDLAVSPDGRTVAMVVNDATGTQLWMRPLDSLVARRVQGTDDTIGRPFWSPDGRYVGLFARGKLLKVAADGGSPQVLCAAPMAPSGSWNQAGSILFAGTTGAMALVSAAGGEPVAIEPPVSPDPLDAKPLCPSFLPDGRHFLFLQRGETRSSIMVGSLDSRQSTKLLDGLSNAAYAQPGYLLFVRDGTLMAQPFDVAGLRLSGEAVPVAEHVSYGDFGRFVFSASSSGVLVYATESPESRLVWYDISGRRLGPVGDPGNYLHIDLSPDDTRVAIERGDPFGEDDEHDIWLMDLVRGTSERFTFDPDFEGYPIWSPDGRTIVYLAHRGGKYGLYRRPASGTGTEELLLQTPAKAYPSSFTPDGRSLVFECAWDGQAPPDLWILPLSGTRTPSPFERTPTWENSGMVSPDGRWIAHNVRSDIYVQSFPTPGRKWQIAAGAGFSRWRRDGKALFYGTPKDGLVQVDVQADSAFRVGVPHVIGRAASVRIYKNRFPYAATSDGQRFLVNEVGAEPSPVTVVLDWSASLRR
jgi:serine/threonine protein kinase/Tol biopolymer transport system component